MATLSCTNYGVQAGSLSVEIDISSITTDTTFVIQDISNLKYTFDIPKSEENPNAIQIKPGSLKLTIFEKLGDGRSFIDEVENNMSFTESAVIDMDWTDNSATVRNLKFLCRRGDIEYKERERALVFDLTVFDFSQSLLGFQLALPNYFDDTLDPTATNNVADTEDDQANSRRAQRLDSFIADSLVGNAIFNMASTPIVETSSVLTTAFGANNTYFYVDEFFAVAGGYSTIGQILSTIAALEGSTFGVGFDRAFYVYRLDTSNQASLDYNDFEEFELIQTQNPYGSVRVAVIDDYAQDLGYSADETISTGESETVYDSTNDQGFNSVFDALEITQRYINGSSRAELDPQSGLTDDLLEAGVDSYARSTGTEGARHIKFKVWGMNSLMPWQPFTLTNEPTRYDGAIWRPSEIEYSWKEDFVMGKAYQIN